MNEIQNGLWSIYHMVKSPMILGPCSQDDEVSSLATAESQYPQSNIKSSSLWHKKQLTLSIGVSEMNIMNLFYFHPPNPSIKYPKYGYQRRSWD